MMTAVMAADGSQFQKDRIRKKVERNGLRDVPYERLSDALRWNLCRVRLAEGLWDWNGWELRSDWSLAVRKKVKIWDGREEGRLWVIAEEGVGDEIMAASCFHDLPACTIECDKRLKGHFERSFPQHRFVPRVEVWPERDADFYLPMMDVFTIYRKSPKDCPGVPYLLPDVERVRYWRELLPSKVGIAWSSRHGRQKPDYLRRVADYPVSLQYGEKVDWAYQPDLDPVYDFADQINLIAALDKVVSGPMSVVHAAGALGIQTHVIMPPYGSGKVHNTLHWRYLTGLPFYGCAKVYRTQEEFKRGMG